MRLPVFVFALIVAPLGLASAIVDVGLDVSAEDNIGFSMNDSASDTAQNLFVDIKSYWAGDGSLSTAARARIDYHTQNIENDADYWQALGGIRLMAKTGRRFGAPVVVLDLDGAYREYTGTLYSKSNFYSAKLGLKWALTDRLNTGIRYHYKQVLNEYPRVEVTVPQAFDNDSSGVEATADFSVSLGTLYSKLGFAEGDFVATGTAGNTLQALRWRDADAIYGAVGFNLPVTNASSIDLLLKHYEGRTASGGRYRNNSAAVAFIQRFEL